jgi:hypothetical protein
MIMWKYIFHDVSKLPRRQTTNILYAFLAFFIRFMYSDNYRFLNFNILTIPRDLFKLLKSSLYLHDFLRSQILSPYLFPNTFLALFSDHCNLHNSLRIMRPIHNYTTSFQLRQAYWRFKKISHHILNWELQWHSITLNWFSLCRSDF